MTARITTVFTHATNPQKFFAGIVITLVALGMGWYLFADTPQKAPPMAPATSQASVSQTQLPSAPAAHSALAPLPVTPETPPSATPEPPIPVASQEASENPFTPLLPGSEHESFKEYAISAMAAGTTPGSGIAVVNGKILHEGDKLGLAQLVRIGSDSLIFLFDKRYYVLYPRQESAPEQKRSPSRKGKP